MTTTSQVKSGHAFGIPYLVALCLAVQVYTKTASAQNWELITRPPGGNLECVAIHPENPELLFIGAEGKLYVSSNDGKNWKQIFNLGMNRKINRLYLEPQRMFLLTSKGLFESRNQGKNWKRIFSGRRNGEANVLDLHRDPSDSKIIYLATAGGLFRSQDDGRSWKKETNELGGQSIHNIAVDQINRELFIATEKGLYRALTERNRLDRLYVTRPQTLSNEETSQNESLEDFDSQEPDRTNQINTLIYTHHPFSTIAIGTSRGVFVSEDEGNHWERLPSSGLRSTNILDLAYASPQKNIIAATDEGLYFYDPRTRRWRESHQDLLGLRINQLALPSQESEILYAVTPDRIVRIFIDPNLNHPEFIQPFPQDRWNLALEFFRLEPTVRMIQKQAIKYANVSNWKTKRWQWASRLRALIPSLSIGKDFSRSDSIDLDRGGTNDADRYIVGPPSSSQSWDFDISWDLSEFIWNSAQTSIDSREKLMVELRDDILSEVTRLYFERRRAQIEFILKAAEDPLDRVNERIRIEELSAGIDALTDGYLSKELNQIYTEQPEFQTLWDHELER